VATLYRTLGGSLGGEPTSNSYRVGEATLRFDDCRSLQFDYRFDATEAAAAFAGMHGRLELQRVVACSPEG
jgi:hypothetical protein